MFAPTQWTTNILSNERIDVNAGNTEHSLERVPSQFSNDDEIDANAGNIEHLSAIHMNAIFAKDLFPVTMAGTGQFIYTIVERRIRPIPSLLTSHKMIDLQR